MTLDFLQYVRTTGVCNIWISAGRDLAPLRVKDGRYIRRSRYIRLGKTFEWDDTRLCWIHKKRGRIPEVWQLVTLFVEAIQHFSQHSIRLSEHLLRQYLGTWWIVRAVLRQMVAISARYSLESMKSYKSEVWATIIRYGARRARAFQEEILQKDQDPTEERSSKRHACQDSTELREENGV